MRLVICICIIFIHPALSISQPSAGSDYGLSTCEPVSYDFPTDLKSDIEVQKGNANWHNWLGGKLKKIWRSVRQKIQKVNKKVKGYTRQVVLRSATHPLLMAALVSDVKEKKEGKSIGFWALMTYLASLIFLAILPSLGVLGLFAAIIMGIIGTVRDKDGVSILVMVLGFVTLLFILVLAAFRAFAIVLFLGG